MPRTATIKRPQTRVFVSPREPNTKFLVERGPDLKPGENPLMQQDIFASFNAGICETTDEKVIAWLEAHVALVPEEVHEQFHLARDEEPNHCGNRGVCMDAGSEQVGFWADQEGRKLNLANREAQLPSGYNVEAALQGRDPMAAVAPGDTILSRAQGAMAAAGKAAGPPRTNNPERFHQAEAAPEASEPGPEPEGGE